MDKNIVISLHKSNHFKIEKMWMLHYWATYEKVQISSLYPRKQNKSVFKNKWWNRELTLKCKFKC